MPTPHKPTALTTPSLLATLFIFAAACASTPSAPPKDVPTTAPTAPETPQDAQPANIDYDGPGYDARLTNLDYPFQVNFFRFEAQRQPLEMAYMDISPDEPNGEAVLLLHGKNFSGAYWKDTIQALLNEGYRVVVPDQIGFGKSTKPEAFQFSFQALAASTKALLDELGVDQAIVIGHSMGGMVGTQFVTQFPEKAKAFVMVNPIGLEDWQRLVPYQPIDAWFAAELGADRQSVKEYMRFAYFDGQWKEDYDELIELQAGWTEGPDKERIAWVSALTYDMIFTQPVLYQFPDIKAPTLLIIGQRDRTALGRHLVPPEVAETLGDYPALGRAAHQAIPNSQLVEMDNIGHAPQAEDFNAYFKALKSFLDELP